MKTIEAGGLVFGQGLPKICVPLTAPGLPALLEEAAQAAVLPADLYEWRLDGFSGDIPAALHALGKALPRPLLCTLRTQGEGGAAACPPEEYEERVCALLELGGFALVDIELSQGRQSVGRLVEKAKGRGIAPVVSKHDFQGTPPAGEIAATLEGMAALGAALPKYAVTPQSPEDVLGLMSATLQASRAVGPVVTMAMGPLGKVTRVSGGVFGSCMTFGAGPHASAPGQVPAEALPAILQALDPDAGPVG